LKQSLFEVLVWASFTFAVRGHTSVS